MTDLTERQTSRQTVYEGRVVRLHIDEVALPNGVQARRELVQHPGAVAIVPFDAAGNVILVRQYRYAAGRVMLEIPAGTLQPGEPPLICAIRELQEETGFKPGKITSIGGIFVAPGYTTEFIHLFTASELTEARLAMDEDEMIEVVHKPLAEVVQLIRSGEIIDGKTVSAILLAKEIAADDTNETAD